MNTLSILTSIYTRLFNHGLPAPLMGVVRLFFRKVTEFCISKYENSDIRIHGKVQKNLIVSFTSFPARINNVWKVIVSLKNQTVLPEKIILWLSKDQFPTKESIPSNLWSQTGDLFEIKMVDGDIRSHKKHHYMLIHYPEKSFITCDDDVIYDSHMIERLVECSKINPRCVIANHTWKIEWNSDGNVAKCTGWKLGGLNDREDLLQIGIGGVLYPPNSLHELVTNAKVFMSIIPMADDIWLNCMARLKGTPVVQTNKYTLTLPIKNGSPCLTDENDGQGKNEMQLQNLRLYLQNHNMKDVYFKSPIIS